MSEPTPPPATQPVERAPLDVAAVIVGGVFFVLSFVLPYWGATGLITGTVNAWHDWDFLAMVLLLAATVLLAVRVFAAENLPDVSFGYRWLAAGIGAVGFVIFLIRTLTLPSANDQLGDSIGVRWGGWVDVILYAAFVVLTVLAAREAEGNSPWPTRPAST